MDSIGLSWCGNVEFFPSTRFVHRWSEKWFLCNRSKQNFIHNREAICRWMLVVIMYWRIRRAFVILMLWSAIFFSLSLSLSLSLSHVICYSPRIRIYLCGKNCNQVNSFCSMNVVCDLWLVCRLCVCVFFTRVCVYLFYDFLCVIILLIKNCVICFRYVSMSLSYW